MDINVRRVISTIFVLIFILGALAFETWLLLDPDVPVEVKGATGAAVFALIGVVFVQHQTKYREIDTQLQINRREIEARLFKEKSEGYNSFIDMLNNNLQSSKVKNLEDDDDAIKLTQKGVMELRKTALIWGNSETIRAVNDWSASALDPGQDNVNSLLATEKLLSCIRKDLGHEDTLEPGDLTCVFVIPEDKHKIKKLFADQ